MKELKFRAFHKPSKKMFDVGMIDFAEKKIYEFYRYSSLNYGKIYGLKNCELMQYTGLKDSTQFNELTKEEQEDWLKGNKQEDWKGKEIFEGDIVDIQFDEGYSDDYIEIEEGLKKSYEIVIKKCNLYLASEGQFINISKVDNNFSEIRIIGNRFQNPELKKVYKPVMV